MHLSYTQEINTGSSPVARTNMTKQYNILSNKVNKTVYSDSYLTALIEESLLLKKSGIEKFVIDVFNKDVKLATLIRS